MTDIPSFPYGIIWEQRELLSVANLTRKDGIDFLRQMPQMGLKLTMVRYALPQANQA